MIARLLSCALALTILASVAVPARAEVLMSVPMTGKRVRPIETDTLFHTLFSDFFDQQDGTTYVQTGDIPAMWLRDASAQTIPYVRFVSAYPSLQGRITGVIERLARNMITDRHANAFMANYHVWEHKWEIDSLAWPVILASIYWRTSGDRSIFTGTLHRALFAMLETYRCEQRHNQCSRYRYPFRVPTFDRYNPNTGMIWSAFRPSDDPVLFRFNIPQNALAVIGLRDAAVLAREGFNDPHLADGAMATSQQIMAGILQYGRVYLPERHHFAYAYEVDGYGGVNWQDDANIPNLLTLPYIGWCSGRDPTYLATRAFVLSKADPFYFTGTYGAGLGSYHTASRFVWPLGIIGRALTSTSSAEVAEAITTLAETDSKEGLIHESFYVDGYWRYTRSDFGWANALYAELLFRSIAGMYAEGFSDGDEAVLPGEHISQTPTLTTPYVQWHNAAAIYKALDRVARAHERR